MIANNFSSIANLHDDQMDSIVHASKGWTLFCTVLCGTWMSLTTEPAHTNLCLKLEVKIWRGKKARTLKRSDWMADSFWEMLNEGMRSISWRSHVERPRAGHVSIPANISKIQTRFSVQQAPAPAVLPLKLQVRYSKKKGHPIPYRTVDEQMVLGVHWWWLYMIPSDFQSM